MFRNVCDNHPTEVDWKPRENTKGILIFLSTYKNRLEQFEAEVTKNLRTTEPQVKFTGSY